MDPPPRNVLGVKEHMKLCLRLYNDAQRQGHVREGDVEDVGISRLRTRQTVQPQTWRDIGMYVECSNQEH